MRYELPIAWIIAAGVVALTLFLLLQGCTTTPTRTATMAAQPVIAEVQALHDAELQAGVVLVQGASIRSLMGRYGHDPEKLWAALVLGDYQDEIEGLLIYLLEAH